MCLSFTRKSVERGRVCSCVNFENIIKRVNNNSEISPTSALASLGKEDLKFFVGPAPSIGEDTSSDGEVLAELNGLSGDSLDSNGFKKSLSFGGFARYIRQPDESTGMARALTNEELNKFFDAKEQEPSKSWKIKIKEYAQKYRSFKSRTTTLNPWYKEFFLHAQPAHIIVTLAFLYLAFRLFPDARRSQTEASTITRLLYVASVSAVCGTQFWMTFFSGIALFLSVSRHTFGRVQLVLFPLYFLVNSVLMLIVIVTYTQHNPTNTWDAHQQLQGVLLVTSFVANLVIRVYMSPMLTKLIKIKMAIEEEAGLGAEIGSSHPGVLENCPHYMRLYRAFRRTHVTIAAGNMISVAATSMHMYYIATKLCSVDL